MAVIEVVEPLTVVTLTAARFRKNVGTTNNEFILDLTKVDLLTNIFKMKSD